MAKGGRRYQEDRSVMLPDFNEHLPENSTGKIDGVKRAFFAVFDGHGGDRCSDFLKGNFHSILAMQQCLVTDPKQAIIDAWETADQIFLKECRARQASSSSFAKDGSTASVVLIVDQQVYCANSGDSPIMTVNKDREITVVSEDHGTNNKAECERIVSAGARIVFQQGLTPGPFPLCCIAKTGNVGKGRVYPGGLLITRSFGDYNARLPELGGNPNGITNIPYVHEFGLDLSLEGVLLASDGVTDALRPTRELQNFIGYYAEMNEDAKYDNKQLAGVAYTDHVCKDLIQAAVEHDRWGSSSIGADNATVIFIAFGI